MIERASTPLPRDTFPIIRVTLEISHSSVEDNADHENPNSSLDSLDTDCKRLKLSNSFETVESREYSNSTENYGVGEIVERPESPDEQLEECDSMDITTSGVFIVEGQKRTSTQSVTSAVIADYLEQVVNEDADSYFVTPPGPLKKINMKPTSPSNDLELRRTVRVCPAKSDMKKNYGRFPTHPFQARHSGYAARPMTVALSQSALGLECGCKRNDYGRCHGCRAKLTKKYIGL